MRQLSGEALTEAAAIEREYRDLQKLGHIWMITAQHRYGRTKAIPQDRLFWASCTCGWMAGRSFSSEADALNAHGAHTREKAA